MLLTVASALRRFISPPPWRAGMKSARQPEMPCPSGA